MATIDIVDYYLGAILLSPESVRIDVSPISLLTLTKLGLLPFLHHAHGKPFLFCDVLKTVPGLPQSGLLSQLRLVSLLTQHGFSETTTPMLFRHHTHSTAFTLVVDDFLVRYSHPSELDHLVSCLATLYELKVHRDLPRYTYLGYTLDYSPTSPSSCMTLSMLNYIPSMLSHLCSSGCGSASSPAVYNPPVPYPDPSIPATLSTLVSPAEKTWIQQVVGCLLFYARALDLFVLIAVCQLSSHQSNSTQHDLSSAHRLINHVSSQRNPHKTIHPSSMALWCCTDASYLSRPKSGSVAGCSVGLGDPPSYLLNPPPESRRQSFKTKQTLIRASRLIQFHPSVTSPTPITHNAPLHAFCQRIPVVVASVAEAEYAAAFGRGQVLVELTLTLTSLGHPPPLLFVDNECAIGLTTSSVRPKKSKSIEMRLDWLKERASQQFFCLVFIPGLINPADFFTKILPIYRHIAALPFLHGTPYPIPFSPNPIPITSHPHARPSRRDAVHDRDPPALATP
jgi:hypothetical protein